MTERNIVIRGMKVRWLAEKYDELEASAASGLDAWDEEIREFARAGVVPSIEAEMKLREWGLQRGLIDKF